MENLDMKELLMEEFENDPIYRMAVLNGLEDSVFTNGILSMHKDMTYSTVEAGRIIERSDSTIRNHFRSDLIEYIQPEKFGKYYRLNYKSVFRLHLIFILMDKASKTSVDLLAELGMQPGVSMGGNVKRVQRESSDLQEYNDQLQNNYEERLLTMERNLGFQSKMLNILKYEKDISDIERKLERKEVEIDQIKTDAYMKYLEEKQTQLLSTSLKKSVQKSSFLGLFKKPDNIDVEQINKDVETKLKEKMDQEIKEKINIARKEVEALQEEKRKVTTLLQQERESFSNMQLDTDVDDKKLLSANMK
ncbi:MULTISPECIES: hypothetical protein [Cytobacillus]|uniref:Uncharacterized protein n=2 Tax=Cytobacillus TaxID=2675230 RepID=A0AA46Q6G6_CYTFI|nr:MULTISPECIES: hypothetical protein [Cytobacillus]AND43120.1 hypothetical protein A361_28560 [Cytobacillus oceanisediminis 2691]MCM3245640.1 hypothetical protein [Cytobacillus oceanisediminis]USK47340.1 hypothetical protein LIT27_29645 [Cytobacillus oceanisediminis]UYG98189.1 hypothetical protein OD459_27315 [Cytobacillus firmus]